ncbi:MAG: 30S ribosomal protein S3 [Candidatus Nanohaloarchaea archaeon]|nr:30S ribosomal protein S3 [Candidatus Nanohaloarchaea archaeon]
MIEKEFIERGITKAKLEEFLERELRTANYSHIDITKTPTSTNITIYAEKPGLVIGRGGSRINEIIDALEEQFDLENPQVDAQEVEEPDLDANVVAKNVAGWLEKGGHPKRVGNTYMRRVMEAGAIGVEIEISGKLSGSRGRTEKFIDGYVKKCGDTANKYVDNAYEKAVTKPGALGVKVSIMTDMPEHMKLALQEDEGPSAEEIEAEAEQDDVDYAALVQETIADIKERVEDEDLDPAEVLAAEEEHKNRTTLVSWLEGRISGEREDAGDEDGDADAEGGDGEPSDADDTDYEELVEGTVEEVKDAVRDRDLVPEEVLEAEKAGKSRKTLTEWLERRVE